MIIRRVSVLLCFALACLSLSPLSFSLQKRSHKRKPVPHSAKRHPAKETKRTLRSLQDEAWGESLSPGSAPEGAFKSIIQRKNIVGRAYPAHESLANLIADYNAALHRADRSAEDAERHLSELGRISNQEAENIRQFGPMLYSDPTHASDVSQIEGDQIRAMKDQMEDCKASLDEAIQIRQEIDADYRNRRRLRDLGGLGSSAQTMLIRSEYYDQLSRLHYLEVR